MTISIEQLQSLQSKCESLEQQVEWLTNNLTIQSAVVASLLRNNVQPSLNDFIPINRVSLVNGMPKPNTLRTWIREGRLIEYENEVSTPHAHYKREGSKRFISINCNAILKDLPVLAKRKLNHV